MLIPPVKYGRRKCLGFVLLTIGAMRGFVLNLQAVAATVACLARVGKKRWPLLCEYAPWVLARDPKRALRCFTGTCLNC